MSVKPNKSQSQVVAEKEKEILDLVSTKGGRLSILRNAKQYLAAGVELNFLQKVFDEFPLPNYEVAERLDDIVAIGIKVDVQRLAKSLTAFQRIMHSGMLGAHGVNVSVDDEFLEMLINEPAEVADHMKTIARCGVSIDIDLLVDVLMEQRRYRSIAKNLDALMARGAVIDIAKLTDCLKPAERLAYRKILEAYGAKISIRDCLRGLSGPELADTVNRLGLVHSYFAEFHSAE